MSTVTLQQQQRQDTAANWTSANPVMLIGELGYESDTGYWKTGDGVTAWTSLSYNWVFGGDITATGNVTASSLSIEAAQNLYLDGGTDTYIREVLADRVQIVAGGTGVAAFDPTYTSLGVWTFNTDQALTATEDGYVATYDDGSGEISMTAISIPLSQISDVTALAAEVNLLDLAGLTAGWVLSADTATTASWKAPTGGAGNIGGSIADNQIAVGATTADDIEGSAALTFDGTEVRTTGYFTVNNAAPEIRIEESDEGVGDKNWRWRAFGQQLTLNLADDTYSSSSNAMYFSRSGNTMTEMGINTADVTLTTAGGTLSFQEATSAATGLGAGKGRLWVRNDVPNVLVFKDDAGTDWDLNVASAGTIGGSIANNQVAVGATTANEIEGDTALTFVSPILEVGNSSVQGAINITGQTTSGQPYLQFKQGTAVGARLQYLDSGNTLSIATFLTGGQTQITGPGGLNVTFQANTETLYSGQVNFVAGTTLRSSFNVPTGAAKTTPAEGDFWKTATDVFMRINGVSESLLGGGGGITATPTPAANQLTYWDSTGATVAGDPGLSFTTSGKVLTVGDATTTSPSVIVSAAGIGSPRILFLQSGGDSADLQLNDSQSEYQLTSFGTSLDIVIQPNGADSLKFLAADGKAQFEGGVNETAVSLTGTAVDCEAGTYFYKTISGATTLTFTNPAATGKVSSFTLELTNPSTNMTWPASVDWAGGSAPTLTTTGVDILTFLTRDGGTTWHGFLASANSS